MNKGFVISVVSIVIGISIFLLSLYLSISFKQLRSLDVLVREDIKQIEQKAYCTTVKAIMNIYHVAKEIPVFAFPTCAFINI